MNLGLSLARQIGVGNMQCSTRSAAAHCAETKHRSAPRTRRVEDRDHVAAQAAHLGAVGAVDDRHATQHVERVRGAFGGEVSRVQGGLRAAVPAPALARSGLPAAGPPEQVPHCCAAMAARTPGLQRSCSARPRRPPRAARTPPPAATRASPHQTRRRRSHLRRPGPRAPRRRGGRARPRGSPRAAPRRRH